MAPAPNPGPSAITVAVRGVAAIGIWRLLAVAMPHLAALVIMDLARTPWVGRNTTRRNANALAGDGQETHDAAGTWAVS